MFKDLLGKGIIIALVLKSQMASLATGRLAYALLAKRI